MRLHGQLVRAITLVGQLGSVQKNYTTFVSMYRRSDAIQQPSGSKGRAGIILGNSGISHRECITRKSSHNSFYFVQWKARKDLIGRLRFEFEICTGEVEAIVGVCVCDTETPNKTDS